MEPRRVLIVESQNEFALSLASVLREQGYTTALAQTGAEAQREIEKRRPDLVVLRAELPDMSGFSLCGQLKKQRDPVQIVLVSSDAADAFAQHQAGPTPADGYLAIPFGMEELSTVVDRLLIPTAPIVSDDSDLDQSLDQSLGLAPAPEKAAPAAPVEAPKGPPKLPKRERRSALTDDDRQFLERVFGSIADRKAELLAEAKSATRRPPPRRELLASPEGKLTLLREEVKTREAQIARVSEIWGARERELLSVEDRLHDKDVESQGLKMQIDDLLRRFQEAQEAFVQKEREHGATVDDLLLQRFSSEKDLIEVVAAKEKDINALRRELNHRDDELARRAVELETAHEQYGQLEKQTQLETLQAEVREKQLHGSIARREVEIDGAHGDLAWAIDEVKWLREERDARLLAQGVELKAYARELAQVQSALDQAVAQLTTRAEVAEAALPLLWQALAAERTLRAEEEQAFRAQLAETEDELFESTEEAAFLRVQRDGLHQSYTERVEQRQKEIERLSGELTEKIRTTDEREAELTSELHQKLEKIGELEGEGEALKQHLEEREKELNTQLTQLIGDLETTQADLEQNRADLAHTQTAKREGEEKLAAEIAGHLAHVGDLERSVVEHKESHAAELSSTKEQHATLLAQHQASATARETDLTAQIDGHLADASALREKIGNLEGELAALQQVRAELEQNLSAATAHGEALTAELSQERTDRAAAESALREQVGNLEGEVEGLKAQRTELEQGLATSQGQAAELEQLLTREKHDRAAEVAAEQSARAGSEQQLSAEIAALREQAGNLEGQLEALSQEKAQLQSELAALQQEHATRNQQLAQTQGQLTQTAAALAAEQQVHGALRNDHDTLSEEHHALGETHKALQTDFGEREGQLTRLQGEVAATEAKLHATEDKLEAQTEELARQKELLSNELTAQKQALSDTKGKLAGTLQEKQRRETELKLELDRRVEAGKALEAQLQTAKSQADERQAETEKKRAEVEAGLAQQREQTRKVTATASELQKKLEQAMTQLEASKKDASSGAAMRDQKLAETAAELAKEKAARRKLEEDSVAVRAQAEGRIKEALSRVEAGKGELAQKEAALSQQLQARTKKAGELEAALEAATSARSKLERDAATKQAAAEGKERELMAKLQQSLRQLKEQEAKTLAAVEEATAKAKLEIDRRDQQRAAEIQRLQQSVQEKTKALKVAELEVQRLKSRADAPAAAARPAPPTPPASAPRPPSGGVARAAAPRPPQPQVRPPSDFESTSMMNRNNLMSMLQEEQQAKGAPKPAGKNVVAAPARTEALEDSADRTVVMRVPTAPAAAEPPEDDWTSLVDSLDK
jgi:ParB family chromosome partitioning protein